MANQMKIIVVEDNNDMYETYVDTADDLSSEELTIELERKVSAETAREALLSNEFDGAIVDLNLNRSEPKEASGNDIISEIVEKRRFPVFVVSGNLQNLDPALSDNESAFFKAFDRDTENREIFLNLIKVFNTGITRILGGRGRMEEQLDHIFWRHLAKDFDIWANESRDMERNLLRYTVSHLTEYLDIPDGEDRFYHEAEFYIKPPIREYIATGDILELDDKCYINLSPACDIAVRGVSDGVPDINADKVVLAPLIKVERGEFIKNKLIKDTDSGRGIKKAIEKIIKGQRDKYIFLPSYSDVHAAIVDLQNICTCSNEEYMKYRRVATVTGFFLKDIQSKFSAYLGRQGQPDLNKDEMIEKYKVHLAPER